MTAAPLNAGASALLVELKMADRIIGAMLNAMTMQQKAKVHEQLDRAGVSGEGMTRANERLAVIEAAEGGAAAHTSASSEGQSQQLLDIEARAVDILLETERAEVLLQAVFDQLDRIDDTAPGAAAINCFATCTARAVALMHEAADNIVALVAEGGAA
ncbi:hypothetical protein [Rugamonas sp.]|uniref:hypothetical protein n=1 Tax=Rugamonas sp. TaxID=1926287 RepID=UPI0025E495E0|nr:hypothetical protein [Rugamonas sp.]